MKNTLKRIILKTPSAVGWLTLTALAVIAAVSYIGVYWTALGDIATYCDPSKHFADQRDECAAAQAVVSEVRNFAQHAMRVTIVGFLLAALNRLLFPTMRKMILKTIGEEVTSANSALACYAVIAYAINFFALVWLWQATA